MRQFEYDQPLETTMGNATFVEYSNGGQTYRVKFIDGPNTGSELSLGERAILTSSRDIKIPTKYTSKYAPYIGNETIFDAPVDLFRDGMAELMAQVDKWVLAVSASPDGVATAVQELLAAGLENPSNYITEVSVTTHGVKYDLFIPDPEIAGIDIKTGLYFNPIRLASGYYQIGRKEFALAVATKVRILEVGEKLRQENV